MKKLGKLQINPEKLLKNKELVTLRGGYGLICYGGGGPACGAIITEIGDPYLLCSIYCPGWTSWISF
jgi:hypothetical protein